MARAMSLPAWMAAMVGRMPIMPTMAVTTISASVLCGHGKKAVHAGYDLTSRSATAVRSSFAFSSVQTASQPGMEFPDLLLQQSDIASCCQSHHF